jgi:hypothetical protein
MTSYATTIDHAEPSNENVQASGRNSMLKRATNLLVGTWWGPYAGVLFFAALSALLLVLFVVPHAAELLRVLRAAGG